MSRPQGFHIGRIAQGVLLNLGEEFELYETAYSKGFAICA
jgi:hypothetical protein